MFGTDELVLRVHTVCVQSGSSCDAEEMDRKMRKHSATKRGLTDTQHGKNRYTAKDQR